MDQVDPQINNYSVSLTISQTWYWIWPAQNGVCQIFHKYSLYVWMDLPDELFNIISLISMVISLPIRYSPMASYFQLSIIFLTPQILWHAPCQCNPPWHLCDHHRLYPIPTTPSAWYHIGDLPYDLWTMLLYFPFLVSFLLPNASCCSPTNHKSLHHVIGTLPYVLLHTNLVLILLIICIQDFCIYSKKEGSFSPELRFKFILSHHFTSLCLTPSPYFTPLTHFTLSYCPEPSSHTTSHSLVLVLPWLGLGIFNKINITQDGLLYILTSKIWPIGFGSHQYI